MGLKIYKFLQHSKKAKWLNSHFLGANKFNKGQSWLIWPFYRPGGGGQSAALQLVFAALGPFVI